jgi:hypothetical protein
LVAAGKFFEAKVGRLSSANFSYFGKAQSKFVNQPPRGVAELNCPSTRIGQDMAVIVLACGPTRQICRDLDLVGIGA